MRNSSGSTVSVPAVGPVRHGLRGAVVGEPIQRHGIPRAVPGEPRRERAIVLGHPDGRVHVEPRVRSDKHTSGLTIVEEFEPDEVPEHRAADRLRQARGIVQPPRHECPVRPEPAAGDEEVPMRMPVRLGARRLKARDDPHGEVALAGQQPDGGGDGAGGDAGDLAEQAAAVQYSRHGAASGW